MNTKIDENEVYKLEIAGDIDEIIKNDVNVGSLKSKQTQVELESKNCQNEIKGNLNKIEEILTNYIVQVEWSSKHLRISVNVERSL